MGTEILRDGSLKKIYVMPNSHHDYAWVYERQWHKLRYIQVFNDVLDWLENNPNAKWVIDNVIHSLRPFLENCPERVEEFKSLVKAGRIEITNGGYSLARPSYVGEETFVRNLIAGDKFFRENFEINQITLFYNFDTACGQQQMPQLIKLAGMKYYRFQRPEASLDARSVPRAFIWEGLDKSRVLVARGFCGGFLSSQYTNLDFDTQWEEIREKFFQEELSHRRIAGLCPADIELISYGCDDSRPPLSWYDREIRLEEFIQEWNKREEIEMVFSTAGEYFAHLETKELPVYRGGLDQSELTYNLPAKGDKSMWRIRGELDKLIVRLENLCAMTAMLGELYPENEIKELWYQLFEITGHAIDFVHRQDNQKLMNCAMHAKTKANMMLEDYAGRLAYLTGYSMGMQEVVINTQSFERNEVVRLYITSPTGLTGFDLYDANGNRLDYQVVRANTHFEIPPEMRRADYTSVDVLAVVNVPAFGYTSLFAMPNGQDTPAQAAVETYIDMPESAIPNVEGSKVINNGLIEVSLCEGCITSIKNLKNGQMSQAGAEKSLIGLRCIFTAPYTSWCFHNNVISEKAFIPGQWKLIENGPIRWRYRVRGAFSEEQKATYDVIINRNSAAIEFELILDAQPDNCYYTFDVSCDGNATTFADSFFGVEPRDAGAIIINEGECYMEGQLYGRNFISFENNRMPMSLVSGNCSVYYIHDCNRGKMSLFLTRNCILEDTNEHWNRNLSEEFALKGEHHFNMSLYLNEKSAEFRDIQQYVKAYHHPCIVAFKNNRNYTGTQDAQSLISNHSPNYIQSAVYFENGYFYLRFFETQGETSRLIVTFHTSVEEAYAVDFQDKSVGDLHPQIKNGGKTIEVDTGAWKIVTLKIKFKN